MRYTGSRWRMLIAGSFLLLAVGHAMAQVSVVPRGGAAELTYWSARFDPPAVPPGSTATLRVKVQVNAPWHLYDLKLEIKGPIPTTFNVQWPEGVAAAGDWSSSRPAVVKHDPNFGGNIGMFDGEVEFLLPVRIAPGATSGDLTTTGTVRFMICTDETCLPPVRVPWTAALKIDASLSPPPPLAAPDSAPPADGSATPAARTVSEIAPPESSRSKGLMGFLLLAIVAGFASLLTPCVFPMVPITISFFTKRAEQGSRGALKLASVYALGIILTFAALGLGLSAILGIVKGVSGAGAANWIAANPWVNLALGALFVFFALSLFGLFEIQLPTGLTNKLQQAGAGRTDILGALIMAVVFTLVSFTCTVQFVGFLLVEAARGDWLWPGIGMVVYATAFASPFFLLALFPQALARIPRSGPWLHSTKVLMGFLELAAAFKFISNADLVWSWDIFNREMVLAAWVAISVFTGMYLLGKIPMKGEPRDPEIGTIRLLLSLLFVGMGIYLGSGLAGNRLHGLVETYLPIRAATTTLGVQAAGIESGTTGAQRGEHRLAWYDNLEDGLGIARRENRPVFLDFTGVTCTNCRWMEINIFERPEMEALFARYVLVRLYTDEDKPESQANQRLQIERFGTAALPLYAVLDSSGNTLGVHAGIERNPAKFSAFLQKGLAPNSTAGP